MSAFDLVPQDYRVQLAQHQLLRQFGGVLIALALVLLISYLVLAWLHNTSQRELESLQAQQVIKQQQINTYQGLRHEQSNLKSQVEQLAQFQGSGATRRLLSSVETAAADGQVWLTHWRYNRQTTDAPHQVELQGDAMDHGALSDFVQQLLRSPEIVDASITRSTQKSQRLSSNGQRKPRRITFRLDIKVRNAPAAEMVAGVSP